MDINYTSFSIATLSVIFILALGVLVKSSDKLVDNAVTVSRELNVSEVVIGATIVSIGTTLPELSSSIMSVLNGVGSFALGNAVGSIITNTTLILGVGSFFGSIPIRRESLKKSMFLFILSLSLVIISITTKLLSNTYRIPQWTGFILLFLVPVYSIYSFKNKHDIQRNETKVRNLRLILINVFSIFVFALLVTTSASILVDTVTVIAQKMGVSEVVISSTIVALGTSLPELSTVITSVRKKAGAVAVGNIIGANILNIIVVIGFSTAMMNKGVVVSNSFMKIQFPFLIIVTGFFLYLVLNTKRHEIIKREGLCLVVLYTAYIVLTLIS